MSGFLPAEGSWSGPNPRDPHSCVCPLGRGCIAELRGTCPRETRQCCLLLSPGNSSLEKWLGRNPGDRTEEARAATVVHCWICAQTEGELQLHPEILPLVDDGVVWGWWEQHESSLKPGEWLSDLEDQLSYKWSVNLGSRASVEENKEGKEQVHEIKPDLSRQGSSSLACIQDREMGWGGGNR